MGARRLGQDEQYLTVREILSEASTLVPPPAGLSRERRDSYRFGYATLGLKVQKKGLAPAWANPLQLPLVREGGFEPPHPKALDPKSSASASSATLALS